MNLKTTIILIIVALFGLASIYCADKIKTRRITKERRLGQELYPGYPVNDIAKITLKSNAGTATLERHGNVWETDDGSNYRADYDKVCRLLDTIYRLQAGQEIHVRKEGYQAIKVANPDEVSTNAGVLVETFLENGEKQSSFIVGRTKMASQEESQSPYGQFFLGQYLRLSNEEKPMLVKSMFMLDPNPSSWQDRFVLHLKAEEISSVKVNEDLLKGKDGDFTFADGTPVNPGVMLRLTSVLSRLETKAAQKANDEEYSKNLTVTKNDGLGYVISGSGGDGEVCWIHVKAFFEAPDRGTNEVTQVQKKADEKAENQADLYNDWFSKFRFQVDKPTFLKLFPTKEELLKPEKSEDGGEDVSETEG